MTTGNYRRDLDGLRAIAVLAVIANHFSRTLLPGGYLGVDVFFVISGFVITQSLASRTSTGLAPFLAAFYARRAKRLLPALIVCVSITALLISLVNPDPGGTLRAGAFALFGLSNYAMVQAGADYFSPSVELNALLHTWSLGVEEQFYVFFPLFGWLVLFRDPSENKRRAFVALVALAAAVSLFAWSRTLLADPMRAFFLTHFRFWELAVGCILAMQSARPAKLAKALWGLQGIALIALMLLLATPAGWEGFTTPAIVLATAVTIWAHTSGGIANRALTSRIAVWFGTISYSLYLWHWPVLVLSRWTIGINLWSWPIQFAVMIGLAYLSYRFIENPLRARRWTTRPWADFALGMAGSAVAAALVLLLAFPLYGKLFVGQRANLAERDAESLVKDHAIPGTPWVWHGKECVLENAGQVGKTLPLDRCTLGSFATGQRRVLVVGNSHSAAYARGFDRLVLDDHYAVTVTSSFGAAPLQDLPTNAAWQSSSDYYWKMLVPRLASTLRSGDAMLVISDMSWLSPGPWERDVSQARAAQLRSALVALQATLAPRGITLLVVYGVPFVRDAGCTPDSTIPQWFRLGSQTCSFYTRGETQRRRHLSRQVLEELSATGKIVLVDVFDVFCPGETCTYQASDGRILYRDEHSHPSLEAMGLVAPVIRQALMRPASPIRPFPPPPTAR